MVTKGMIENHIPITRSMIDSAQYIPTRAQIEDMRMAIDQDIYNREYYNRLTASHSEGADHEPSKLENRERDLSGSGHRRAGLPSHTLGARMETLTAEPPARDIYMEEGYPAALEDNE